uniref:Uncharacterized protein n=1 Tax=Cyprinus carpio carpio TaxID=630221 RepID=A0A9J7WWY7_CYPCA
SEDCVYFAGNSPEELEKWATIGVHGYLKGSRPWAWAEDTLEELMDVALMNGLTVNLHLLMLSFYKPTPKHCKILLEEQTFPSDHGCEPELIGPEVTDKRVDWTEDVVSVIERERRIALVMLSGGQYYTGQLLHMEAITRAAHTKVKRSCSITTDRSLILGLGILLEYQSLTQTLRRSL